MADIAFKDVTKRFADGTQAVTDMNLEIADGEFMILVGPSGCGKSTALRMIAGLEDISEGQLLIDGEVVNELTPKERDVAMVFQSYALYPHMTVRENMGFALKLAKVRKEEIKERVAEAAKILDLTELLERKPAQLSGGQRQRVAMGRAIVRQPAAFLMDEPLSNLDAKLRVQMRAEVARIQNRLNTTTVYVTHDQTEAMTLGDRVAIMLHGVLQQVDSPMNLYNSPGNLFVAGFIGSPGMNFLPATVDNGVAKLPMVDGKLPQDKAEKIGRVDAGKKLIAGIRPEDFEAASHVAGETKSRGTTFTTTFDLVEAMGAEYYVHFGVKAEHLESSQVDDLLQDQGGVSETTEEGEAVVVARLSAESRAKTGEPTELWIDATKLHFFDAESGKSLTA